MGLLSITSAFPSTAPWILARRRCSSTLFPSHILAAAGGRSVLGPSRRASSSSSRSSSMAVALTPDIGEGTGKGKKFEGTVSLEEWQAWGTASPLPEMVKQIIHELRALESDLGVPMTFGGVGSKLQGSFKVQEDKKNRAVYKTLADSERKLQYFSARQIACRLLGSRGYLCQKIKEKQPEPTAEHHGVLHLLADINLCWLPKEDCMCSRVIPCTLRSGVKFWLYMHPKDFLRQNNTGKLLWQVFGIQAATLCLFGIHEHEDIMWSTFKDSEKSLVWFLYPNANSSPRSVKDVLSGSAYACLESQMDLGKQPLNIVLLDGTWSNSAAMYRRLKDQWRSLWGEEDLPCISLSTLGASAMHKLRPQPSWDKTCTAAAAAGILSELHLSPDIDVYGLEKQAEALDNALDVLLDALMTRRLRMGRSITRKERHNNCI